MTQFSGWAPRASGAVSAQRPQGPRRKISTTPTLSRLYDAGEHARYASGTLVGRRYVNLSGRMPWIGAGWRFGQTDEVVLIGELGCAEDGRIRVENEKDGYRRTGRIANGGT